MRQTIIAYIAVLAAILAVPSTGRAGLFGGDDEPDFDASASFLIHNKWLHAHGCSVNGYLLTSAHNVDPRAAEDQLTPLPPMFFRYEFRGLNGGIAAAVGVVQNADVGVLALTAPAPAVAMLGPSPDIGDRIRWVEYDWRKQDKWMHPHGREAKVTSIWAGLVILDRGVTPGASGGCAFNDAGQAIGLMTFYAHADDDGLVGGVIGFWPGWWESMNLPRIER